MDLTSGLEPELFWKHFHKLTTIPRESGNEEGVRSYAAGVAEKLGLEYRIDEIGNILIRKPAAPGKEGAPSVVIQGHMDMVCEKNRETKHDFSKDPISLVIEDGWLKADGTTLGADNGVAVAAGLALLESDEQYGPLEVLLTVDEETGLTGAMELDPGMVESRILINLDSEEDGILYIGCAGGKNTEGYIPVDFEAAPASGPAFEIALTGFRGGHSGTEIHIGLGNPLTLGSRFLRTAAEKWNISLAYIEGGGKHNAIPREFFAGIIIDEKDSDSFLEWADKFGDIIRNEFRYTEENILFNVKKTDKGFDRVYSADSMIRIIDLVYSIPHGVIKMSPVMENLVETSTNLARIEQLDSGEFFVLTCQRSSLDTENDDIADRVRACIRAAGGHYEFRHEYPGWDPNPDSLILKKSTGVYRSLFGEDPQIRAIHAGLECGVIGKKFDGIDMISFGPELSDVHTPGERMDIASVGKMWKFLTGLLSEL